MPTNRGPRRATIRDVAREAGVSTTTVSDALAGRGRLTEATRQRVRAAADAVGYVASAAARNLRLGRSGSLGLYLPDRTVGFEYYTHLARGAAEEALGHGYALTLIPAWHDAQQLAALHLDGLIVSDPDVNDPVLQILRSLPIPMVTCEQDLHPDAAPVGVVHSDHAAAMTELLAHLRAAGAHRIDVLAPEQTNFFGAEIRRACRTDPEVRVIDVPLAYEMSQIRTAVDVSLGGSPDALVVVPDGAALGALQHLQRRGVSVPEDLPLASYVDGPSLAACAPSITAVDIDPRSAGAAAVQSLVGVVRDGAEYADPVQVSARLVVRESTQR
ncbi:LacI family DNA-binding transcriptional regulator [Nocardioides limicola]|uniref:LacI family DNA-binding transcriptional regulator n=1 Tax=Nocardioides limicola TaxID=2803368 RepID=UPI00193C30C8|nr:LacI family DNA-binding transcriptional regulator [Nocardioides sp. DJM-14]